MTFLPFTIQMSVFPPMIGLAPVDVADVGAMMTLLMRCGCTIWNLICASGAKFVCIFHPSSSTCGSVGKEKRFPSLLSVTFRDGPRRMVSSVCPVEVVASIRQSWNWNDRVLHITCKVGDNHWLSLTSVVYTSSAIDFDWIICSCEKLRCRCSKRFQRKLCCVALWTNMCSCIWVNKDVINIHVHVWCCALCRRYR